MRVDVDLEGGSWSGASFKAAKIVVGADAGVGELERRSEPG